MEGLLGRAAEAFDGWRATPIEQRAVAMLRPKLRVVMLLKYFEELSYEEIAAVVGCSKGTVASRLNRGHKILARKLGHLRPSLMRAEQEG